MAFCKICKKPINDKYEMCYGCLETYKKQNSSHLETFTCMECGITMHSMLWEGRLCCNCYSYSKQKKIDFRKRENFNVYNKRTGPGSKKLSIKIKKRGMKNESI